MSWPAYQQQMTSAWKEHRVTGSVMSQALYSPFLSDKRLSLSLSRSQPPSAPSSPPPLPTHTHPPAHVFRPTSSPLTQWLMSCSSFLILPHMLKFPPAVLKENPEGKHDF